MFKNIFIQQLSALTYLSKIKVNLKRKTGFISLIMKIKYIRSGHRNNLRRFQREGDYKLGCFPFSVSTN